MILYGYNRGLYYYEVNDTVYYLIIIKETKTYQDNQEDFERLVESIKFIEEV